MPKTVLVLDTQIFSAVLLPATLAFIMVGMGLSLTRHDFIAIARNPRGLTVGLAAQMVALPILAFLIVLIIPGLSPALKVGIILLAACPGGATSNLLNYLLNGNLALSVSITTVNSFITIFTIPLLVNLGLLTFMHEEKDFTLPFWKTFLQILSYTVVPAVIGITVRRYNPRFADKVRVPLKYIMTGLLALAMIGAIFLEKNDNLGIPAFDYVRVMPLTLLLNISSMGLGFIIARRFGMNINSQTTIAIEVGLQNTTLAITVATGPAMLNNPAFAIPAAVYALFSFFTTAAFGILANWKQNKKVLGIKDKSRPASENTTPSGMKVK